MLLMSLRNMEKITESKKKKKDEELDVTGREKKKLMLGIKTTTGFRQGETNPAEIYNVDRDRQKRERKKRER